MKVLNEEIEHRIEGSIVRSLKRGDYGLAMDGIARATRDIYDAIPDSRRTSYGIVYAVSVLSEHLYGCLVLSGIPVLPAATRMLGATSDAACQGVSLGLLSFCGVDDIEPVLPCFEAAAASSDWGTREFAQMFFRRVIKSHPLSIIGELFQESSAYARASVGNNLSDLARHCPDTVYHTAGRLVASGDRNSYWIAWRACRNLVRKEPLRVMDLLKVDEYKYKNRTYRRSDRHRD